MVLTKFARLTLCSLSIAGVLALSFATNSQAGAQAQQQQPPKKETKPVIARPTGEEAIEPNQPIKTDFLLAISVVGEAEPSIDYVVDASGNIQVKYVGIQIPVSVRGLLPAQAADAVAKALKTYIKSPQVTVSIVSIPRPIAFINGAVLNPGPLSIKAETTLIDVLQIAAYREDADLSQVRITRTEKVDGVEKQSIIVAHFDKYIKIIEGQAPSEKDNPIIKDKDRILVLSKVSSLGGTVSVQGEVSKPAIGIAIRTNPPMTVREVINLAGGTTPAAKRISVTIRRPTIDRPLIIDLEKADQGDPVNNIEIRPDDAIYVEKLENNAFISVTGGFVKAGKFVYDKRTTLLQVISEAGGPAPYAKITDGYILRNPNGDAKNTRTIPFNFKKLLGGKEKDIELQAGDSVYIASGQPSNRPPLDIFNGMSLANQTVYLLRAISGNSGNNFIPGGGGVIR